MSAAAAKAAAAAAEQVERKLRPIYEAIDCHNYKLALKSVNALIQARRQRAQAARAACDERAKTRGSCSCGACALRLPADASAAGRAAAAQKHPESHIAKALRAVVLERSGKPAEALAAADELARETPTDEHVLHTLTLVWKPAGKPEVRGGGAGRDARAGSPACKHNRHALRTLPRRRHSRSRRCAAPRGAGTLRVLRAANASLTLTLLRRRCAPQAITAAYEAASAAKPADRALLEAVFGAYVREGHLVKQQQARRSSRAERVIHADMRSRGAPLPHRRR
jgi:hypothetical protein